ncbi:GFA family protein [Octadecabacter sp. G9-8]|uniref:GFA family protein n=1 Tax=Octadecabacter dasysiphoniae TaxID=2909341 RepID=A0ABS9CU56_9RHOB|nr:GFA family protein [Octadecabacter dasysiphoniae]MCF2869939.1 GFA family protein [Octadecabacter dasysiphoniae]
MTKVTCHCRAVELAVTLAEPVSNARRCNCDFCAKRGAAVVFANQGDVDVIKGANDLSLYLWGTRQTQHYFCRHCGIFTHHQHANPADGYAINLAAIDGAHPQDHDPMPWLDGINYVPDDYTKDTP